VDEKRKKGKGNKKQKMKKLMDKGGAKAQRGYPGPTRGKYHLNSQLKSTAPMAKQYMNQMHVGT